MHENEYRIVFEKTGRLKFISHLDLQRFFSMALMRAGIPVKFSAGFNPHPKMSVALPLSVGQESVCEMLDFALEGGASLENIPEMLNKVLPEGISVIKAYDAERKVKELYWLAVTGEMTYDNGVPEGADGKLSEFFAQNSIVISKRSKSGFSDFDIVPCVREISFDTVGENTVMLKAVLTAQLTKKLGRTIRLECTVDPSLLGGMVVRVDGKVIDGSLKHKLQQIKEVMNS